MSPSLTSTSNGEKKKIISSPATTTTTASDEEKIIITSPNVTLKTSYGETFEVSINVISQSQTIKHMIEDGCANEFIPIPNVNGKILSKVIEYCEKHYKISEEIFDEKKKDEIRQWDIDFMTNMQDSVAVELILAANYLEIKGLLDLTGQKIADNVKNYSLEEIRKLFNVKKDFGPGEVEQLKKEYGDAGWTEE